MAKSSLSNSSDNGKLIHFPTSLPRVPHSISDDSAFAGLTAPRKTLPSASVTDIKTGLAYSPAEVALQALNFLRGSSRHVVRHIAVEVAREVVANHRLSSDLWKATKILLHRSDKATNIDFLLSVGSIDTLQKKIFDIRIQLDTPLSPEDRKVKVAALLGNRELVDYRWMNSVVTIAPDQRNGIYLVQRTERDGGILQGWIGSDGSYQGVKILTSSAKTLNDLRKFDRPLRFLPAR